MFPLKHIGDSAAGSR